MSDGSDPTRTRSSASERVEIRLARDDELEAIGRLTVDSYVHDGFLSPGDDYAHHLADAAARAQDAELFVAMVNGSVVGTVTFCPPASPWRELGRDGEAEFRMLAVSAASRGRGVGRALIERCFERARELGLTDMVICSMSLMTSAHRLYAAMGFERDSDLDWEPVPAVTLLGFRRPV